VKNLAQYIEELIIQHECVIVPGLGGFVTYRDKASIRNNQLYAPTQRVRFNQLLTYHDGLLTEAYMRDRQISYAAALEAIETDIKLITTSLNSGNTFILGRIGALSLSADNTIILKNEDCKFLPENIGLPVVNLKQLTAQSNKDNTITLNIPRASSNIIRYAAMIIAVFIFSLSIPTPVTDATHEASFYRVQSTEYRVQSTNSIDTIVSIGTIATIATIDTINTINTINTIDTINTTKPQKTRNSQLATINYKYHLIIASLTTQAEAEEYIANHTHFEKTHLQIIESKGKFRISAAGFNKYKEALQYMDSIRNDVPIAKNAWIMCK
jgi:hypothetical protein